MPRRGHGWPTAVQASLAHTGGCAILARRPARVPGTPPKQLTATVTSETRAPLPDIKIDFSVGGKQIGTATTNAQGIALSEPDGVSIGSEQWTAVHPADTHCVAAAAATYTKQP